MKDELLIRLEKLASNLARIASVSKNPDYWKVIDSQMEESKFFIEWNIKDATYEQLILLSQIQRRLAFWQSIWEQIYTNKNTHKNSRGRFWRRRDWLKQI